MIWFEFITIALLAFLTLSSANDQSPVVGIPMLHAGQNFPTGTLYIYKQDTEWMEQANVRWIPLFMTESEDDTRAKLAKLNGIFLSGGSEALFNSTLKSPTPVSLNTWRQASPSPTQYLLYITRLIKIAMEINDSGRQFPIWGTCLGFQSLMVALSGYTTQLFCDLEDLNVSHPVNFDSAIQSVFSDIIGDQQLQQLRSEPLMYFNHHCGFPMDTIANDSFVKENMDILAQQTTVQGRQVLAAYRHKKYPFVGIQFHPEATQMAHKDSMNLNKSADALEIARKHALVFKELLSKWRHTMSNADVLAAKKGVDFIFETSTNLAAYYWLASKIHVESE